MLRPEALKRSAHYKSYFAKFKALWFPLSVLSSLRSSVQQESWLTLGPSHVIRTSVLESCRKEFQSGGPDQSFFLPSSFSFSLLSHLSRNRRRSFRVSNCFSLFDIFVVLNLVPFLFSAQTSIILTKLFLTHFQNRNCLQSAVCILSCGSFGYTFE